MRRRLAFLLAALTVALTGSVVLAKPAVADGICQDAPAPISPKSGLPGMLTSTPSNIPDNAPDPFTDDKVAIGDVYGYDWQWANYDLGCGNDFLRDPQAVTNTASANLVMSLGGAVLASGAAVDHMARAGDMGWARGIVVIVAGVLRDPTLTIWLPAALIALGIFVVHRARKASYHDTLTTLAVVIGAITLSVLTLVYPAKASNAVDGAVGQVAAAAGSQFPTSATDASTRQSMYRTWLAGNFGDPDSQLATTLGPKLMAATHYTWSDEKRIQADPAAKKTIDAQKAAAFKQIASQIETQNPAAYEQFTGRGERTGPALFGLVVVVAMRLFLLIAGLMIVVSRVMMQGVLIVAPVAALLGIFPTQRHVLVKLWDLFTAALVAVAKFVLAGGVMTLVFGGIQASDINPIAKLTAVIVASVVAIVLTKPIRSVKTIMPGLDPNKSYIKDTLGKVADFYGPAMAAKTIVAAEKDEATYPPERPVTYRSADVETGATKMANQTMPALAPPPAAQPREQVTIIVQEPTAQPRTVQPDHEIVASYQPTYRALPAAPLAIESMPVPSTPETTQPDIPEASEPSAWSPYRTQPAFNPDYDLSPDDEPTEPHEESESATYHSPDA